MIRNNTMEEKEEELKSPADSIRERALSFCVRASLRAMREWCWGQDSRRSAGWAYVSVKTRRQLGKRTAAVEKHYAESVDGPSRMISSPTAHRFFQLLIHWIIHNTAVVSKTGRTSSSQFTHWTWWPSVELFMVVESCSILCFKI